MTVNGFGQHQWTAECIEQQKAFLSEKELLEYSDKKEKEVCDTPWKRKKSGESIQFLFIILAESEWEVKDPSLLDFFRMDISSFKRHGVNSEVNKNRTMWSKRLWNVEIKLHCLKNEIKIPILPLLC